MPDCSPSVHTVPSAWDASSILPPILPRLSTPNKFKCPLKRDASEKTYLSSLITASPPMMSWYHTTSLPFMALNHGNNFTSICMFISLDLSPLLDHIPWGVPRPCLLLLYLSPHFLGKSLTHTRCLISRSGINEEQRKAMKLSVGTVGRLGEMNKQNTNDLCLLCYLAIVLPGEDECLLYLLNWDWRLESEIKSA